MYFICWVLGVGILPEVSIVSIYPCVIPVEAYTRGVGAGRTISKRTPHSLDREDRQDFAIRCRTYSNSKSSDRIGIDIPIRSELSYWIAHSMSILNIMPWRGLEPPRSLARDFESRVSTISPSRHLESESYSMNMISIECDIWNIWQRWSLGVFRSIGHIGLSQTSNSFDLHYP